MNLRIKKSLSETPLRRRARHLLETGLLAFGLAGLLIAEEQAAAPDLTVHEWGTFTAVAGKDGSAVDWTPFSGTTDLPEFVEHLTNRNFKAGLRGKIRM